MHPINLYDLIEESANWLRQEGVGKIDFGITLGSGLGAVADRFESIASFAYSSIPHLPGASVQSHKGVLHYVKAGDKYGLVFKGRIHYYEGYEMWQVGYPVRLLKALGADLLITTGAAGGLNPAYKEGDVVVLKDHINLMPENPLRGSHDPRLGVRFPDMSEPYSEILREGLRASAKKNGFKVHEGVYAALPGPSLETRAEYDYLHRIGADLVAMSIVPEVLVGVQCGMRIAGVCIVSNVCYPPEKVGLTTIDSVISTVKSSATAMGSMVLGYIYSI